MHRWTHVLHSPNTLKTLTEWLISPLRDNDLWHGSIKLEHCTGQYHTTGHLKTHSTKYILQLTRVRMECRFIQFFSMNDLFKRCCCWLLAQSNHLKRKKTATQTHALWTYLDLYGNLKLSLGSYLWNNVKISFQWWCDGMTR